MEFLLRLLYKDEERLTEPASVAYWRQVFYSIAVLVMSIWGLVMLTTGIRNLVGTELSWIIRPLILYYSLTVFLIFARFIPKYTRYILAVSAVYLTGLMLLFLPTYYNVSNVVVVFAFVMAGFIINDEDSKTFVIISVVVVVAMSIFFETTAVGKDHMVMNGGWYNFVLTTEVISLSVLLLVRQLIDGLEKLISKLSVSETRTRAILESMSSGVIRLQNDGKVLEINSYIEDLFKVKVVDYIGEDINQIFADLTANSEEVVSEILQEMSLNDGHLEVVVSRVTGNLYLNCQVGRMFYKDVDYSEYVMIIHDITEIREAAKNMVHGSKIEAIGTIAGGIAHDFNNMLGGILGYAQLNKELMPDNMPKLATYNQQIIEISHKASWLTKQLLTYARKEEVSRRVFDLRKVLLDTLDLMDRTFEKKIHIVQQIPDVPTYVEGDSSMLENALLNIGINAKDASEQGKQLLVTSELIYLDRQYCSNSDFDVEPGEYISIIFEDEGHGMSDEVKAKVFEPFFTTKEVGKGTGLGLSAALGTIISHHGEIKVISVLGEGTSITISLPISQSEPEEAADDQLELKREARRNKDTHRDFGRMLIIDDEVVIRDMLSEIMAMRGCEVLVAVTGEEGLELFADPTFSVRGVFLDMIMPGINGSETLKRLKAMRPDLPVVIMSGFMDDERKQDLYGLGADDILSKPFTLNRINEVLDRWNSAYKIEQE